MLQNTLFKKRAIWVSRALLLGLGMVLASCSSVSTSKMSGEDSQQALLVHELQKTSREQRPNWINEPPVNNVTTHFLVGLSNYHTSERAARRDSMRHARQEFAAYTGVDVKDIDQLFTSLYGKESQILDAQVTGLSVSTQKVEAPVSRIKAKQWYWEKYTSKKAGVLQGAAYKYWVLVTIPADEYHKVQAWKRQRDIAAKEKERARLREEQWQSDNAAFQVQHEVMLGQIHEAVDRKDPLAALDFLRLYWHQLTEQRERTVQASKPGRHVESINNAIHELKRLGIYIAQSIWLDNGRWRQLSISPFDPTAPVPLWIWFGQLDEAAPLSKIPVVLVDSDKSAVAKARTNVNGVAYFDVSHLAPGQYQFEVDSQSALLANLPEDVKVALNNAAVSMHIEDYEDNVDSAIDAAILEIFNGSILAPLLVQKVTVGAVGYRATLEGSVFSKQVRKKVKNSLLKINGLTVMAPRKRTKALYQQVALTRAMTFADKTGDGPGVGSGSMQALMDGAEAVVEVSYELLNERVMMDFVLRQAGTDIVFAAVSKSISKASLPDSWVVKPTVPPLMQMQMAELPAGSIELEITSQLGDGQTYIEGDVISYFLSSNQDAYLTLIYQDAEGQLIQILPNPHSKRSLYKAGEFFEVPANDVSFEFKISAPFGQETVYAFAATEPLPNLDGKRLANGLLLLQYQDAAVIIDKFRRYMGQMEKIKNNARYGESSTVITTIATHKN